MNLIAYDVLTHVTMVFIHFVAKWGIRQDVCICYIDTIIPSSIVLGIRELILVRNNHVDIDDVIADRYPTTEL